MNMINVKKILLSLGLCVATNVLHANVKDLERDLRVLKGKLGNLTDILGTLGETAGGDGSDSGNGAPPPPPPPGNGPSPDWQKGKKQDEEPKQDEGPKKEKPKPKTPEPKSPGKKPQGPPGMGSFDPAAHLAAMKQKKASGKTSPTPGSGKTSPTLGASDKDDKNFTGKIDTLEIPRFEKFYGEFLDKYFKAAFAKSTAGTFFPTADTPYGSYGSYVFSSRPSGVTRQDLENVKDIIGRAIFERNVLQLCREYIDKNDSDRSKSGQKPRWVYDTYLSGVIDSVIDQKVEDSIQKLLTDTAQAIAQAVDDMFIHRERGPGIVVVDCGCLDSIIHKGYRMGLNLDKRIPLFQGVEFLQEGYSSHSYVAGSKPSASDLKKALSSYNKDNTFESNEWVIIKQDGVGKEYLAEVRNRDPWDDKKPWVVRVDDSYTLKNFAAIDLGKFMGAKSYTLGQTVSDENFKKRARFAPDNTFDPEEIVMVEDPKTKGTFIIAQVQSGDTKSWAVQIAQDGTQTQFTTVKIGKLKHPLALPIAYLVFETMHTTLFHGLSLTDDLIPLFDFTRDLKAEVVTKNKTSFKVGYDQAFEDMMKHVVGNEEQIKDGLFTGNQLTYDKKVLELKFLGQTEPQPRMVIFGKKPDTYWSQGGGARENWPDREVHYDTGGKPTEKELLYALWYHLWRHTCYSVGLLPENIIPALELPDVVRADLTEMEAKRHVNENVRKFLIGKAEGLRRVPPIVAYLIPKLKTVKKGVGAKTEVFNIINNIDEEKAAKRAQLLTITADEWATIAAQVAKDPEYNSKIKWIFLDDAIRKHILHNLKKKDPAASRMYAAFDQVNQYEYIPEASGAGRSDQKREDA